MKPAILPAMVIMAAMLSGCADSQADTANEYTETSISESRDISAGMEELFSERDMRQTADLSSAVNIAVSDGALVDITDEGVYVISGTAENCTIKINAADDAKVQLVLSDLNISNENSACIYVLNADKTFITLSGDSSLSVTGDYAPDSDSNVDAVIFSKDDLTLNGTGSLTLFSETGNGVTSKDDMKITGGDYSITAAKNGLEANDSISVADGNFVISAHDGIHCENNDDSTKGSIFIGGGSFDITASDDGIRGTADIRIDSGNISITAAEGIESTYICINGGTISIDASDDGINAARKSTSPFLETAVEINGGDISIVMGQGDTDAIDANGSIYVNGGNIDITAQSAFDFDKEAQFNGGTVYVNGEQITEITNSMFGWGGGGGFPGFGGNLPDGGGDFPVDGGNFRGGRGGFPIDGAEPFAPA